MSETKTNSTTLVSLAMLKVCIDSRKDYLDYLRPFILDIIDSRKNEGINEKQTAESLEENFGLSIPERSVQIVLRRIVKDRCLVKKDGLFVASESFPASNLQNQKAYAERNINAVISDIKKFWKDSKNIRISESDIIKSLLSVLSDFTAPTLSAYLKGTAIPDTETAKSSNHVLIGKYLLEIHKTNPESFERFLVLLKGHMVANAILCPDLKNVSKTYKDVTFYLDTPIVIRILGFEGDYRKENANELIGLLRNLNGRISIFTHTLDEIEHVLKISADFIGRSDGNSPIVMEARKSGITKSDILLFLNGLEDDIAKNGIEIKQTPRYSEDFQIDETEFEHQLDEEELFYRNPNAKLHDINSVRSIYELRKGNGPRSIEKCKAIFVTSNSRLSKAAYEYGKRFKEAVEVSVVITDFSLANVAWLKAPVGAPSLPAKEILAYSYASMIPSSKLLEKFLVEIEKLEKGNRISERDHQLLRGNVMVHEELVVATMGNVNKLTDESALEVVKILTEEIKSEEKASHDLTKEKNRKLIEHKQHQIKAAYWKCDKKSRRFDIFVSGSLVLLSLMLFGGFAFAYGLRSSNALLENALVFFFFLLIIVSICNLVFGVPVKKITEWVSKFYMKRCIKLEEKYLGFKLDDGFSD